MNRLVAVRGLAGSRPQDGQALTEFAIVTPVLFLLLFGIIQFGIVFGSQIGMTNAAREAARYATTYQITDFSTRAATVRDDLVANILPRSIIGYQPGNLVGAKTTVSYCDYSNADNTTNTASYSVRVVVQVQYKHPLLIPFVGTLVDRVDGVQDNALTTTVTEGMRIETLRLSPPFPTGVSACP